MAVSYLSSPFKSSPYVLPIDLGLMDKVLSVKQDKFDKGAAKTQALVDQMGTLDVLKDGDREYLNSKINSIVESVNGLGGVDYSDTAIMSQIEAMGSDVYGDEKVLSAVASTRSVRNLMKTYENFKTNPKLSKLYSESNEAYDMRNVSAWMNDGQVGSSYKGPSSATPYTPYRDNHMKVFEKLKADLKMTLQDNGLFYSVTEQEFIHPERVMAMAANLMTPAERAQMKRDAWYLYNVQSPTAPETLVNKALGQYANQINRAAQLQAEYEAQAKAAVGDNEARIRYNSLALRQQQEVERLKANIPAVQKNAIASYQADPEEFQYQLYSQDYFSGIGDRFSVNRTKRDIKADQAEMFTLKYNQENFQFNEELKRKDRELDIKQQDADTRAAATGLKMFDPTTGKMKFVDLTENFQSTNINTEDPEGLRTTENTILEANKQLELEIGSISQDFISKLATRYPNLGLIQHTKSGTGIGGILKGQQALEDANGVAGFQIDDLKGLQQEKYVKGLQQGGMSEEGIKFLKSLSDNFVAMSEGRSMNPAELPAGAAEMFEKAFMVRERINANNAKIRGVYQAVNEQVMNSPKLSNAEKVLAQDYFFNPAKYNKNVTRYVTTGSIGAPSTQVSGNELDPRIQNILEKAGVDIEREKNNYFKTIGTRDVFRTQTFGNNHPLFKNESLQNYVVSELGRLGKGAIDPRNVSPVASGMKADGSGSFYIQAYVKQGSGENATEELVDVPISVENAKKIGLNNDPYNHLNYSVNLTGRSGDIPVYGNKNMSLTINIVKENPNSMNEYNSFAQAKYYYLDDNGQKIPDNSGGYKHELIDIPATNGMTPSEAYARAKQAVQQAAQNKVSFEEFKNYLINYKP